MKLLKQTLLLTFLQALLLAPLLYWGPTLAGVVSRSTKPGSTTSFAVSNSLGNTLQVADLDTDLNNVYSEFNGNIESANVKDGTLVSADLSASAGILGSQLSASAGIVSGQILDGTLLNADLNAAAGIVGTKLAVNAVTHTANATAVTIFAGPITTVENYVGLAPAITTRGGRVHLYGTASMRLDVVGTGLARVILTWYRDLTVVCQYQFQAQNSAGSGTWPVPTPECDDTSGSVGTFTYNLKAITSSGAVGLTMDADPAYRGVLYVREDS